MEEQILLKSDKTSYYDERVKNLINVGKYVIVDEISLPDGEYDLRGSSSVCYINKDGKDTGYAYVTTGKISGFWAFNDFNVINIVGGKIHNLKYGEVYKMLYNQSRVGMPSVE